MSEAEKALRLSEEELPAKAGEVFAAARARVLASGQSVVESRNDYLYEIFPDGREVVLRQIDPPRKVAVGQKFIIP